jgi:hypothetical protein
VPKYKPEDYTSWHDEFMTFLTTDLTDLIAEFKDNYLPVPPAKRTENICLMKALFQSVSNAGTAGSSALAIIRPHLDTQRDKFDGIQAYRALHEHHTGFTSFRRRSFSRTLFTAKQKQGETALAYFGRINEIANSIRGQGTKVDDNMLLDCYLETLLPKYELIVQFFINNDKPFAHFLQECADLEQKHETPALHTHTESLDTNDRDAIIDAVKAMHADYSKAAKPPAKKTNDRKRSAPSSWITYDQLQSQYKDKPAPFEQRQYCNVCKTRGHSIRTCQKATAQQKQAYAAKRQALDKTKKSRSS